VRKPPRGLRAAISLVILAPVLAVATWQLRLALLDDPARGANAWGVGSRVLTAPEGGTEQAQEIRRRFAIAVREVPLRRLAVSEQHNAFNWTTIDRYRTAGGLATPGWLGVFLLGFLAAMVCADRETRRTVVLPSAMLLLALFTFYELVLLRLYLTAGAHGLMLSSFVRYTNTLMFPMLLVALSWFAPALHRAPGKRSAWSRGVALTGGLALAIFLEPPLLGPLVGPRPIQPFRHRVQEPADRVSAVVEPGARVFVYMPRDAKVGRRAGMLLHAMTPTTTTVRSSTERRVLEEAYEHDYLWLVGTTPEFESQFLEVFGAPPPRPGQLYRIERVDENEVRLRAVLVGLLVLPGTRG
jgi:hypothetical protein